MKRKHPSSPAGWTAAARDAARSRARAQYGTPEARSTHGELTRQKMGSQEVRERIRAGMARAADREIAALLAAWQRASKRAREQFLMQVAFIAPRADLP